MKGPRRSCRRGPSRASGCHAFLWQSVHFVGAFLAASALWQSRHSVCAALLLSGAPAATWIFSIFSPVAFSWHFLHATLLCVEWSNVTLPCFAPSGALIVTGAVGAA